MLQTTGDDYYDIPDDELPSANFAARPTSEISDLNLLDIDGLRTWMSFASTSSESTDADDFDDGPTPTALTPDLSLMPRPEMPGTPPDTPAIEVTPPSRTKSLRQKLKRMSGVVAVGRKSSTRQKADTAPPGAFDSPEYAPQVPRRAVSAKLQKRVAREERHSRHLSSESDLKARTILGLSMSPKEERPTFASHWGSNDSEEDMRMEFLQPNASFSRKPRVRETLEKKQLSRLTVDFVGKVADELVDSPHSMLGTPEELYAAAQPPPQPARFRTTSAIHGKRGTSTPVSPKTPSPFQRQPLSKDSFPGDEDLEDLYRTRVYVSGPICLEQHPAMLRKNSVATLDPFASEVDSIGRRPSDQLALERIFVYFDGMGMGEPASDECLDRYWLHPPLQALQETALGVTELEPLTPRSQQSGSSQDTSSALSRFSFSSASSDASVAQGSPQKRQLVRLRKLLLPALPGLKGFDG
ncbi:hypothetical protein OPT61_g5724 [Boeremia exigua]|uniref:Uncharacterized protein n=1 Tax=Boeremia exigua TaxID=749465 RepID=A0ACC2I993_9PLEO|nr:hypothetical protein OPT61_g5724 [Boeremia exigua]